MPHRRPLGHDSLTRPRAGEGTRTPPPVGEETRTPPVGRYHALGGGAGGNRSALGGGWPALRSRRPGSRSSALGGGPGGRRAAGLSIRWKLALTYFALIVMVLGGTSPFVVRVLERDYIRTRETSYLMNANIVATSGQDALLQPDRSAYYLIKSLGDQMGARVLVLDRRGRVTLDSFGEGWLEGRVLQHDEVVSALNGSAGTGVHTLSGGEKALYVAVPILEDKSTKGAVMLVAGLDDVYATIGQVRRQLYLASLVSGFIAAVVGLWLAGLLTRPVRELIAAVRGIAKGHLEQHVPVRSGDELGQLAAAFNAMSARLAEVDRTRRQFLADTSHELKSPLSSMKVLAQSLLDTGEKDPTVYREFLQDIDTEIDRLAHLVDDMLQLTRLEEEAGSIRLELLEIAPLIEHVTSLMRPRAETLGISLKVNSEPDLKLPVNRDLFVRILFNLLDNALRHTPAGGTVKVEAVEKGEKMILKVADTGEGIPAEDLPRIFDRFYRVDRARSRSTGGTGLGLAIVRQAVLRHGGEIGVSSRPGEGTVFEVAFPRATDS